MPMNPAILPAATELQWIPKIDDRSSDDRELVVVSRRRHAGAEPERGVNIMQARFARFIVRDAIRHGAINLPHTYIIEPANDAERARAGHGPITEETKARLRAARLQKRELRERCRVALDGPPPELCNGATDGDPEQANEGEATMSKMTKAISDGVKSLRGKKSKPAARKATPKKVSKKPAAKKSAKAAVPKPKRECFVVTPDGETTGPFTGVLKAAQSVGYMSEYCRPVGPGHYTVTQNEKVYHIVTPEAAKRDSVTLAR
jgi:hypothetical protein